MSVSPFRVSPIGAVAVLLSTVPLVGTTPLSGTAPRAALVPTAAGAASAAVQETPEGEVGIVADTLEDLAGQAMSAVVLIEARSPAGNRQGSGFFVDPSGRILTNHHVIRNAASVQVKIASGDVYDRVTVLGVDERRDLAVLQIPGFDLPALTLGNSDSVRIGSSVIVIGSPLGLENTVSTGIVSGRRQEPEGFQLLQISAPASQGSSGGPVLSRRGHVIGVAASQLRSGQNLNFAVPINYARGLLSHLDEQPVAVLSPPPSPSGGSVSDLAAGEDAVNRNLDFELEEFRGYDIELEGRVGEDRSRRTRISYRRIEAVGDAQVRIERYAESETTERRGPFGTPQTIRRERSRTIVSADGLRPISAQGEVADWAGGEWRQTGYNLRFDGYRVRGTMTDTAGRGHDVDRTLPRGTLLRDIRDLAFASLATDSLIGHSVEFVTFDPQTGELTNDRYDILDTASIRVAGRSYQALEVNVATGLTNSTAYFRVNRPRVLLRKESGADEYTEEVTAMDFFGSTESSDADGTGGSR